VPYLGEFEQLILFSVLQLGDDAYGVAIREHIEERTGRTVSVGAIYTALGRMEGRGLVRSRSGGGQGRAGRPRKIYSLRKEGAQALRDAYTVIQSVAGGLIPRLEEVAER
jgi:DNA-binding PadR family transcriptional regulator